MKNQHLVSATGIFICASKARLNVSIESVLSRIGGMGQPLNFVILKISGISDNEVHSNLTVYQSQKNIEENNKKLAIQKTQT